MAREAQADLDALAAGDAARLLSEMTSQLTHEPKRETRNRKPMCAGGAAAWELRVPPFRVFYDVDEAQQRVKVIGVARKDRETARSVR